MDQITFIILLQNFALLVKASRFCVFNSLDSILKTNGTKPKLTVIPMVNNQVLKIDVSPRMRCAFLCEGKCPFYEVKEWACHVFNRDHIKPAQSHQSQIQMSLFRVMSCSQASFSLLIFRHDSTDGTMWSKGEISKNVDDPTALIDDWRARDGKFHFMLCYPGLNDSPCFRWSQNENPLSISENPSDFAYNEPSKKSDDFVGLSQSSPQRALLDGSEGEHFWFAVGCYAKFGPFNVFPGPGKIEVSLVELFLEV